MYLPKTQRKTEVKRNHLWLKTVKFLCRRGAINRSDGFFGRDTAIYSRHIFCWGKNFRFCRIKFLKRVAKALFVWYNLNIIVYLNKHSIKINLKITRNNQYRIKYKKISIK
mgnify:CR=1 FL=1